MKFLDPPPPSGRPGGPGTFQLQVVSPSSFDPRVGMASACIFVRFVFSAFLRGAALAGVEPVCPEHSIHLLLGLRSPSNMAGHTLGAGWGGGGVPLQPSGRAERGKLPWAETTAQMHLPPGFHTRSTLALGSILGCCCCCCCSFPFLDSFSR